MNSKSIQGSWCYRCKLLSLWISSLHILGFFLHSLYFENVLQEYACTGVGWGVRPKRIFEYKWVGVKKGCFGTYVLYGWPHFMFSFGWFPQPVGENIFLQKLRSSLGFSLLGPNLYKRKDLCIQVTPQGHFCLISGFNFELILFSKLFWDHPLALFRKI